MTLRLGLGLQITRGGAAFSPLSLDPVAFYDPSDTSTLFQDAAGTTPVTTAGDPVRLILDLSGNGNHLTAPSDAARPTYQTSGGLHWLDFDGVDDEMNTASALPFSPELFNCTAFRLLSFSTSFPHIISHRGAGAGDDNARQPLMFGNQSLPARMSIHFGTAARFVGLPEGDAIGVDVVLSGHANASASQMQANTVSDSGAGVSLLGGNSDAFTLSGPNKAHMRFYGTVQANYIPSGSQIAATRQWFAARSGGVA